MLNTSARISKTTITSEVLVWQLNEEADRFKLEEGINKVNAAMIAVYAKAQPKSSRSGDGEKGKRKAKSSKKCGNCKKKGHTEDNCFAKGGGKADQAPDWWKERQEKAKANKGKGSKGSKESAQAACSHKEEENFVFLTIGSESF